MSCEEFLARLDAEGEVAGAEAQAHAATCTACGRALAQWQQTRGALRALADEEPPPFLTERVMARVRSQRRDTSPAHWRSRMLRPAAAVAMLVLVSLSGYALWTVLRSGEPPLQQARNEAVTGERKERPPTTSEPVPAAPLTEQVAPGPGARREAEAVAPLPHKAKGPKREELATHDEREADAVKALTKADEGTLVAAATPAAAAPAPQAVGGVALRSSADESRRVQPAATGLSRAEPAVAVLEAKRRAPATEATVEVVVRDPASTLVATVHVIDLAAPPIGTHWLARVDADGSVFVTAVDGSDIGRRSLATVAALQAAGLAPGSYTLHRR